MEYIIEKGTKAEVNRYLNLFMNYIRADFSGLSDKHFNQVFCEALGRNLVVEELENMMSYILENESNSHGSRTTA